MPKVLGRSSNSLKRCSGLRADEGFVCRTPGVFSMCSRRALRPLAFFEGSQVPIPWSALGVGLKNGVFLEQWLDQPSGYYSLRSSDPPASLATENLDSIK